MSSSHTLGPFPTCPAAPRFTPSACTSPQMLDYMWPALTEALGKEPDVEVQSAMLDAVSEIVDMVRSRAYFHQEG